MEQKQRQDASSSPQPEPVITKGQFFKQVTVDKYDRFALVFFILNTLHQLENSDRWYCYCSEKKSFWTKIISKGISCWLLSHCQICVIPEIFNDFESFVDNNIFNMMQLRRYYVQLQKELIKCFNDSPRSTESFLGGEHYFGGRDWNTGKYWSVSLSESICYSDGIFLACLRDEKKKNYMVLFNFIMMTLYVDLDRSI